MIDSYGVRVGRELVLDTAARDCRLPQAGPSGQITWETIGRYPPWVSVKGPDVSLRNPITASFTGLDLLWPVALQAPPEGVTAKPLVKTSPSAWLQEPPFLIDPYKVDQQGRSVGQYVLAMALTGKFPSWFSPAERSPTSRMIVIGDDDFLTDLMQFSDSLVNVLFVENAVLWLSGNEDLLSIKSRAGTEAHLDRIQDPVARARLILAVELVNVVLIPAAVLLAGLLVQLSRREKHPSAGARRSR
jgi:ABC-type uncharacterized transport system involved in gliding motility auxiliary subunit